MTSGAYDDARSRPEGYFKELLHRPIWRAGEQPAPKILPRLGSRDHRATRRRSV